MSMDGITFTVDLHWDLFSYTQLAGRSTGAMFDAWNRVEIGDDGTASLPEDVHLAFLCAHAILDHRFRLILFRDLSEIARSGPNWEGLLAFADRYGQRSLCYTALMLSTLWAGAVISPSVIDEMRPSSAIVGLVERLAPSVNPVRFYDAATNPLHLAIVLLHDDPRTRARLLIRAPTALPGWLKRTAPRRRTMQQPRAMVVVSSNARRGAEVFGDRLVRGLRERGWEADLASLTDTGDDGVPARPLSDHRPHTLPRLDLRLVRRLRSEARTVDVVLANGSSTLRYLAIAVAGMAARPAFVYASIGEPLYWTRTGWSRLRQRLLTRQPDLIAAVSRETARQLTSGFGVPLDRVYWAPTGVEVPEGCPARDHEGLNLLLVGSLSPEKQPEAAIEVVARTAGTRLRLVGDGPLRSQLETEVVQRGLTSRIEFIGSVQDLGPHYMWADVLILTSRTEGLPGVVLEAAAHSRPSVAFDVGGTAETIVDGSTGKLIPPGEVELMVDAVNAIGTDRDLIRRMGLAARQYMEATFSLESSLDRYDAILRSAMALRHR